MKWKNLKLWVKFTTAFGLLITFLIIVSGWAIVGINGIVGNAEQVIDGNKLRTEMTQRYVDHLKWAAEVCQLFSGDTHNELNVQLDHTHCALGKWYYGDDKAKAIELAPGLKPYWDELEEPHILLHQTAKRIKQQYKPTDIELGVFLSEQKSAHLEWLQRIQENILAGKINGHLHNVEVDPTQCNFGKWMADNRTLTKAKQLPALNEFLRTIKPLHDKLHENLKPINAYLRQNNHEAARTLFNKTLMPQANSTIVALDKMQQWQAKNMKGYREAQKIFNTETQVYLAKIGELLSQVNTESEKYIMTDATMLVSATRTQARVSIASLAAILLSVVFAVLMSSGITAPLAIGVGFAEKVAKGDLSAKVSLEQNDEVGMLTKALQEMAFELQRIIGGVISSAANIAKSSEEMSKSSQELSQGASEQAAAAEEISSSMEEMASNIMQNADNAQQAESIVIKAVREIKTGNDLVGSTSEKMKVIARKVSIVSDIAFQTNILALNAAVEAARAGEHGKGFAVVAAEVRKLAERSRIAATEIDQLSKESLDAAELSKLQLTRIVPEIERTAQLVQKITGASLEQRTGADQVNTSVQDLNSAVQQNAASAEEMATNSEELAGQANYLKDLISYFKTDIA